MARRRKRSNSDYLRNLIERSLSGCPEFGGHVEVDGEIHSLNTGLWHDNYWFKIRVQRDSPELEDRAYILRLLERRYEWQQGPKPLRRLVREAKTLQVLLESDFSYSVPEFICLVRDDDGQQIGMIETALLGDTLDPYRDRTTLKIIARVAAAVHGMSVDRFPHLTACSGRTQFVASKLKKIDPRLFDENKSAREARDWIQSHTPTEGTTCLLHGDLLPQNLLFELTGDRNEAPVGIIDWEMAQIGDPAYDLSVVSRGNQKVLGVGSGAQFLVQEYLACGGQPISLADVQVHEMLLILHWLEETWRTRNIPQASGHGPEFYEKHLHSLLRRAAG